MSLLIAGLVVFLGVHMLPMLGGVRQDLQSRLGAGAYRALFSLVSLAGLLMIVWGKARAPFVHIYLPPSWGHLVTATLMLPALILLPAANMPGNIKRLTPHPMLWAVILWSTGHLSANGDLASVLLFGSFGIYAVLDIASANRRGARCASAAVPISRDLMVLAAGIIAYGALRFLHPYLFGVAVA
jgi:uncharacterized membrane protein